MSHLSHILWLQQVMCPVTLKGRLSSKYHSNEQGPRGSCQPPNISSAACDWMWFSGCKALTSKALGYCLSRDKSASALLPGISKKVPATSHPDQSIIWSCPGDMGYCFRDGNFFSVSPGGSMRQSPQSLWHLRLSPRGLTSPCHPCPGGNVSIKGTGASKPTSSKYWCASFQHSHPHCFLWQAYPMMEAGIFLGRCILVIISAFSLPVPLSAHVHHCFSPT